MDPKWIYWGVGGVVVGYGCMILCTIKDVVEINKKVEVDQCDENIG